MRLLLELQARRNCEYVNNYHHKIQGRIWKALKNTPLEDLHNTSKVPKFTFSNPYPRKNYQKQDESHILVASPHRPIIETIEEDLNENREFNVGEMPLSIKNVKKVFPDVGEPGERGVLQCSTGVYIPLSKEHREEYNIDGFRESDKISWTPNHSVKAFNERLVYNINWKLSALNISHSVDNIYELFEEIEFGSTYPIELPIGNDVSEEFTFIVTQIRGRYNVHSDQHRKLLNTVLETGLGWRNTLSFGMTNILQR